jgi:endo-1,4-beta-mannosidase
MAADGAVPEMASLFGARLVDRAISSELTLKIVAPFGDLKPGETFHYVVPDQTIQSWGAILEVSGGKIIAVDQNNRPALVANELGRGKTLLSAYPLEHYIATLPAAFDQAEETHRIYEAFRDWAGIKPLFRVDRPSVEASALNASNRGYVVLVNHSAEPQNVTVFTTKPAHSISRITPEGSTPVQMDGSSWKLSLDAYDGAILEWK